MTQPTSNLLLSIAVPTRNRERYLLNLLQLVTRSARRDFELVVEDNSDRAPGPDLVALLDDSRIKYRHHVGWRSVVENCDAALGQCGGRYVCMIGDDDGILVDEALIALDLAASASVDALISDKLLYTWPDLVAGVVARSSGVLQLRSAAPHLGRVDMARSMKRTMNHSGALGFEGLPSVYHSFISRGVLEAVYKQAGSYFPGPSPDMANAVAIAGHIRRLWRVARPLVVSGHSSASTGGKGATRSHHGNIADQRHLPTHTEAEWTPGIPLFWSGPTIYAQSLYRVLQVTGQPLPPKRSLACLYAACLTYHWSYRREVLHAARQTNMASIAMIGLLAQFTITIWHRRILSLFSSLAVRYQKEGVTLKADSIDDAVAKLRIYLLSPKLSEAKRN